jgi:hypothetical protein
MICFQNLAIVNGAAIIYYPYFININIKKPGWAGRGAHVVEYLPSKLKALGSMPSKYYKKWVYSALLTNSPQKKEVQVKLHCCQNTEAEASRISFCN